MSMRNTALGFGVATIIVGGVAWWGISNSQTQNQAAQAQQQNQIQAQAQQAQSQEQGGASRERAQHH